ncbi:5-methylcytosine-specific restriction protein A [Paucimonas lemoignei]|uniref:5-methylcytosine-specific restriction protein A n=1 Tax=Paucimonas lemoignei TaxID=29443 RepID=A0A4R3HRR9_PAULE|nr:HNH endonuclease signature motif containing protein [Paucimonas lemoignei]TCS35618.1 5-methylcytosine-specific restriction protein A [Paucimonas lemoignei]
MLLHPFVIGEKYRRPQLLEFLGSKQQMSGVLWGNIQPGYLICTSGGRHGKQAGYKDEALADGSWWYFGQGKQGDQLLKNAANARLASENLVILLFTTREPTAKEVAQQGGYGKLMRFEGCFCVTGYEHFVPIEGPRKGDRLIRFRLVQVDTEQATLSWADETQEEGNLYSLREMLNKHIKELPEKSVGTREFWRRSREIRRYALRRANGICEACGEPAPFKDQAGLPFLEVHHLHRLADSGPDKPGNVAAICPNCHRRAHLSFDRASFNKTLEEKVWAAESKILADSSRGGTSNQVNDYDLARDLSAPSSV